MNVSCAILPTIPPNLPRVFLYINLSTCPKAFHESCSRTSSLINAKVVKKQKVLSIKMATISCSRLSNVLHEANRDSAGYRINSFSIWCDAFSLYGNSKELVDKPVGADVHRRRRVLNNARHYLKHKITYVSQWSSLTELVCLYWKNCDGTH